MPNSLLLTITAPGTSPTFMRDVPDGISIVRSPVAMQRGFDVQINVDIDIKLVVDVAKIGSVAAALWIIQRIRNTKIDLKPRINRKELPKNDADAVKMITDAIDNQETKKNDGN